MQKTLLLLLLCSIFLLCLSGVATAKEINFYVGSTNYAIDGESVQMDVAPFVDENNRILVPIRFLGSALGMDVKRWFPFSKIVALSNGDKLILLNVGEPEIYAININKTLSITRAGVSSDGPIDVNILNSIDSMELFQRDLTKEPGLSVNKDYENNKTIFELTVKEAKKGLRIINNSVANQDNTYKFLLSLGDFSITQMNTVPILKDNRIFIPARYIAQLVGFNVSWVQDEQKVVVVN